MYYEIHGSGRPLITLPPSWGLANVLPSLARHRQLIAVEPQGHGRTKDIERPYTFEQSAEDVVALLDHLKIEQADVFGESFGGAIAIVMAIRHPKRVRRVAVYAPPLNTFQDSYDHFRLGEFVGLEADAVGVQFQREHYQSIAPDPSQWATLFSKVNRVQWKGLFPDELKSIQVPVLIASGDLDWIPVEKSVAWFRCLRHGQLAIIPNATHFVLNEDPEKLLPIVAEFLDEVPPTIPVATPKTGIHPGVTR
jgi:pimeloyl-ACP methyl ester carboxylesterase